MQTAIDPETFRTADIANDDLGHPDGAEPSALNVMDRLGLSVTASWTRPILPSGYRVLPEWEWVRVRRAHGLGEHIADPMTLDRVAGVLRGVRRQARARDGQGSSVAG